MLHYINVYINITYKITSFHMCLLLTYINNYMKSTYKITQCLHEVLQRQLHVFREILHVSDLITWILHIHLHA